MLQTGLLRKRLRQRLEHGEILGSALGRKGATPVGKRKESAWAYREAGLGCLWEALTLRGPFGMVRAVPADSATHAYQSLGMGRPDGELDREKGGFPRVG